MTVIDSIGFLDEVGFTREPRKVHNVDTGEIGWAVRYGRPDWGGIRYGIFATRADARDACVSDDVGDKILARGASGYCSWYLWQVEG